MPKNSLTSKKNGEIVRKKIEECPLNFEVLDYAQGRRYIALNKHLTGEHGSLRRTLPWRRKAGGTVRRMTGAMGTKLDDDSERQWALYDFITSTEPCH